MKPTFVSANDKFYREFLKLILNQKSRTAFLSEGLTLEELEECLDPFYNSLNVTRLKKYNVWVNNNKDKIYADMKKMKKLGESSVAAPDNIVKKEIFDNFVEAIKSLCETSSDLQSIVLKQPNLIAEKLYPSKAKNKLMYVKRYLKAHYKELNDRISKTSSKALKENESGVEADDEGEDDSKTDIDSAIEMQVENIGSKNHTEKIEDSSRDSGNYSIQNNSFDCLTSTKLYSASYSPVCLFNENDSEMTVLEFLKSHEET